MKIFNMINRQLGFRFTSLTVIFTLVLTLGINVVSMFVAPSASAAPRWEELPSSTNNYMAPTSATDSDGRFYVMGSAGAGPFTKAERFDIAKNEWQSLPDMPNPHYIAASVVDSQGRIYVIGDRGGSLGGGSYTGTNKIDRFDPKTDTWETLPDMRLPRYQHTAVIDSMDRIYVVGGATTSGQRNMEIFDVGSNTWSDPIPLLNNVYRHASVVDSKDRVYVFGGAANAAKFSATRYDPATGVWTTLPNMPHEHFQTSAVINSHDLIYVVGGAGSNYTDVFNVITGEWGTPSMMNGVRNNSPVTMDNSGKIYAFSGYTSSDRSGEVFDPTRNRWEKLPDSTHAHYNGASFVDDFGNVYLMGGSTSGGSNKFERLSFQTPPSLAVKYSIVGDTGPVGTINMSGEGPYSVEKIQYEYTAKNVDRRFDSKNVNLSISGVPEEWKGSVDTLSWASENNELSTSSTTKTWTVTYEVPKSYFVSNSGEVSITATLRGVTDNTPFNVSQTVTTPVQPIETKATASETITLGTPNSGVATAIEMGDQVIITTTIANTGNTVLTISRDDLTYSQTGGGSRTTVSNQADTSKLVLEPGQSGTFTTKFIADHTQTVSTPFINTTTVKGAPGLCVEATCSAVELGTASSSYAVTPQKASTKLSVRPSGLSIRYNPDRNSDKVLQSGDTITVKLELTNDGNVPLTAPTILSAPDGWQINQDATSTSLPVGGTKTYTAVWTAPRTVKKETLEVLFSSSSIVTSCGANCDSIPGETTIEVKTEPIIASMAANDITITNTSTGKVLSTPIMLVPGVPYSIEYTLRNTGNIRVDNLSPVLTETIGGVADDLSVTCSATQIPVGESVTCSSDRAFEKSTSYRGVAAVVDSYLNW